MSYLGEIRWFAGKFLGPSVPPGLALCDGGTLPIAGYEDLFSVIGTTFGGDGQTTFGLPDLRGRLAVCVGQGPGLSAYSLGQQGGAETVLLDLTQTPPHGHAVTGSTDTGSLPNPGPDNLPADPYASPSLSPVNVYGAVASTSALNTVSAAPAPGEGGPHANLQPLMALNPYIVVEGIYPGAEGSPLPPSPALPGAIPGEVRMLAGSTPPAGFAVCDGSLVNYQSNPVLLAVLGNTFGGVPGTSFALPDMRGRVMVGTGQGSNGGSLYTLGETGGVETVTLDQTTIPSHQHALVASAAPATSQVPTGNIFATRAPATAGGFGNVSPTPPTMSPALAYLPSNFVQPACGVSGGGAAPHANIMPCMGLTFIICTAAGEAPVSSGQDAPVVGEVRMFALASPPSGWLACDGSSLPLSPGANQVLASVIGYAFGGSGIYPAPFLLPNLRSRTVVGAGGGGGLTPYFVGSQAGTETVTLNVSQVPSHSHTAMAASTGTTVANRSATPGPNMVLARTFGQADWSPIAPSSNLTTMGQMLSPQGGGQPHSNLQPYLALNYFICASPLSRG